MAEVRAEQGGVMTVIRQSAQMLNAFQAPLVTVYNIPAKELRVTSSHESIVYRRIAQELRVTQASTLGIARGKVENPNLQAWTFTLDGHDFYVLRLGANAKTLVFDLSTGQWSWWTSNQDVRWRAAVGMNWYSSGGIPFQYGSNVVVGDDSLGQLWVLDPEQGYDQSITSETPAPFIRTATGQMTTKDRNFIPVYSVDLTVSLGQPAVTNNEIKLEYSDDQGRTYVTADPVHVIESENYEQEIVWRSLGQVRSPGRLFRITDNGAFSTLYSMDINE